MATTNSPSSIPRSALLLALGLSAACAVGPKDLVSSREQETSARIAFALETLNELSGPSDARAAALIRELRGLTLFAPRDPRLRTALGALALELGEDNEAARELDVALSLEAGNAPATALRTRILLAEGNRQRARRLVETALWHHPSDPELHLSLAQLEHLDGDSTAALAALDRAGRLGAEPRRILFATGLVFEQAGQVDEALDSYERLLELEPGHAGARSREAGLWP